MLAAGDSSCQGGSLHGPLRPNCPFPGQIAYPQNGLQSRLLYASPFRNLTPVRSRRMSYLRGPPSAATHSASEIWKLSLQSPC